MVLLLRVFLFDIFVDMIDLLPKILKSLEDAGQKESFLKFMGLLASGTFPLHNICYLLFLDIVEWFSCDSTTHMRYGHETVKFWQIGYRLFHGDSEPHWGISFPEGQHTSI
jgi:hypothetical protein